jgi:hypothetical protein
MSGLNKLKTRLNYQGGNQEGRIQRDKLNSLKKALLYSYQAATVILQDGREFRALMNPDKLKPDYDNKIISIPFEDVCLNKSSTEKTSIGQEVIGMKPGDIFTWKETNTFWIVYLQYLEENAYFRAECRLCEEEEVLLGDKKYRAYVRGPIETSIPWNIKNNIVWNTPNYSLIMYIPKEEYTLEYLQRFAKVKFNGKNWEVQTINSYYGDGIIQVCLKESYLNTMEESGGAVKEEKPELGEIYIDGPANVQPYDTAKYKIQGLEGGSWEISNNKAIFIKKDDNSAVIEITTGKSGSFDLTYKKENEEDIVLPITITSL